MKLDDIAEIAGVSKMAVSLALRGDPSISDGMTEKIKQIADSLGYIPNRIAQGLSSGRSYNLTIMMGGFLHDDYQNQIIKGAIPYALKRGYTISMAPVDLDQALEKSLIEKYTHMMVDGFLAFHCNEPSTYKALKQQGIPFVLYTKYFAGLECDYVVCDDFKGAYAMTEHLIGLGHKRIAFVYDNYLESSSEVLERMKGYRQALKDHNCGEELCLPFHLYHSNEFLSSTLLEENSAFVDCLKGENPPTAIFACNDILASFVYIGLKQIGLKIPDDISVAGYEGVYLGSIIDPTLTTISTPLQEMGRKACQILIDKIEGIIPKSDVVKIRLQPQLLIRESTAMPK